MGLQKVGQPALPLIRVAGADLGWGQVGAGAAGLWVIGAHRDGTGQGEGLQKVGRLASPPIGVGEGNEGQGRLGEGAMGGWLAPHRWFTGCSGRHSARSFWLLWHPSCWLFIY